MTRKEKIEEAARIYATHPTDTDVTDFHGKWVKETKYNHDEYLAFLEGAEWADENSKSPWISVKDDLPCNHKDLMKNENYTKRVLVVLSWNEDPTARHIDISDMSNVIGSHNVGFYWRSNGYYTVTHWRRLPELPKE